MNDMCAPKISIIIPVDPSQQYLSEALDSVLNQSLKDIEVLCVDEGSAGDAAALLARYAARDARVRILHPESQDAGTACNTGISHARGEYLHFLNPDDYVLDYAYEALYNKAVCYDLDVLKCACLVYDAERDCFVDDPRITLTGLRTGDFNRYLDLSEESPIYKVSTASWSVICRRSFVQENGLQFRSRCGREDPSFFHAAITNAVITDAGPAAGAGRGDVPGNVPGNGNAAARDPSASRSIMIARDRLVIHRIPSNDAVIDEEAVYFDEYCRSIEAVAGRMEEDGVPLAVQECVLKEEFADLSTGFLQYCDGPEYGERVRSGMASFVEQYRGPFRALLRQQYRDTLKKAASSRSPQKPLRRMQVRHKPCAQPKVSVVVPIYNVEAYLNEALHSLSSQELEEMEFLLVNDGSTDGSMVIMKEYAALDERMRILDGPNGGYGRAMNRGIDEAKGEYLGILEPDDFVPPEMFRTLYELASRENLEIVKGDFYRFRINGNGFLEKKPERLARRSGDYNRVICPIREPQAFHVKMNTWSGIYRREFLSRWHIRHNETPGASYQDNGFWFQTMCRAERLWLVDKAFYMYRQDNPDASMHNRGKVYAMTEEYHFIRDFLTADPDLANALMPVYYDMAFTNFMTTYYRLAPEYQEEYLRHVADELRPAVDQNLLRQDLMTQTYWQKVHEIVADPDAYYRKIRVSVILPVYNAQDSLRQALNGLLSRSQTQFEIICVDDGSTDGTPAILKEYGESDPRVRVITQEHAGPGPACNTGMQYACGEYLSFLNTEDMYDDDMLRKAYDRAHLKQADIVAFRCDRHDEATGTVTPMPETIRKDLLPVRSADGTFAGRDIPVDVFRAFCSGTSDKLFRADFIRELCLCFSDVEALCDVPFVNAAILKAEKIAVMETVLLHHRKASPSAAPEESGLDALSALDALRRQLKDWDLFKEREQDFVNYSLHLLLQQLHTLHGSNYYRFCGELTEGGRLSDFGITAHEMDYFYDREDYLQLQELLAIGDAGQFLFRIRDEERERLEEAGGRIRELERANGELLKEQKKLRAKNRSLNAKVAGLKKEKKSLQAERSRLRADRKAVRSSVSWKIARAITYLPRKVKKALRRGTHA